MTKSRGILKKRRIWTPAEDEQLRLLYPDSSAATVAAWFACSTASVYSRANVLGLKKSAAFLTSSASGRIVAGSSVGADGRFKKGSVPFNKGLRRPGWAPGRMATSQFKKGRPAHEARNYVPIGTERVSKDGYLERKVTDDPTLVPTRRWVGVHRLVWEEANGPIPPGHAIAFRDGNKRNIDLDNLELISNAEKMRRNTIHRYPPELKQTIRLVSKLRRAIEGKEHEEQD